jgi:3-oxoacyl-(acyl-carrier-protein) synthase
MEALGPDIARISSGDLRLGIVFCAMSGCVNFSRRFCDEMLKDPATASPLIFPETVFNAPASHLAALLGSNSLYYTLIGDPGTFLQGLALGADWLVQNKVDGCLVLGAEEQDWLVAEAFQLFDPEAIPGSGAGAVYLRPRAGASPAVIVRTVTTPYVFTSNQSRLEAARRARSELGAEPPHAVLCDGKQGIRRLDQAEEEAWDGWSGARLSPKLVCGDGLMAAAAWQTVVAVEALSRGDYEVANLSIVGHNQQAIAAQFVRAGSSQRPL